MALGRCFAPIALLLVGCGSDVVAPGAGAGDQAAGTGASAGTSSGQGGAGTGGSTISGFGGVGASSTTGAGGTPAACAGAFIEVTMEDGTSKKLDSACAGQLGPSVPVGYYMTGGLALQSLVIEGCASAAPSSERLRLDAQVDGPGSYGAGAYYRDASQNEFHEAPLGSVKLTLTSVGKIGDVIEGNYAGVLVKDEIALAMQGAFSVCHVEDVNLP